MARPYVTSSVITSTTVLKVGSGYIHWVTINNIHATAAAVLTLSDTGTDVWAVTIEALDQGQAGAFHAVLDPPIRCTVGITATIAGSATVQVSVGIS